jgi:hypothetical protein
MAEERTLGQLVAQASEDLSELVRYEIALAIAEIKGDLRRGLLAGVMVGVAAFFGLLALITLVITCGYALVALGLSAWLSFLIITGSLLLLAVLLILTAVLLVKRIKPPERAIRSTKQTLAAVRGTRTGTSGS